MTSRRRYRKRVRFSRRDDVKDTIHLNDLKREANLDNIWFSQEETQAMISQCRDLVESIESGQPVEEECTRGLECYVPSAKSNRQQIIMEALDAVLDEQDLQRHEGINDPELLADLYFFRSYKCSDAAREVGLRDSFESAARKN